MATHKGICLVVSVKCTENDQWPHVILNPEKPLLSWHPPTIIVLIIQQVVIGDQMTCKNIRGCKLWRASEAHPKDRLTWSCEMPGVHYLGMYD